MGQAITYGFVVTNTGEVVLTGVAVDDPLAGGTHEIDPPTLAPGEAGSATAQIILTQADIDRGSVVNRATATGTSPLGVEVSATDEVTVTFSQNPSIGLAKQADVVGFPPAGATIGYILVVTNTGDTPLASVTLTDEMLDLVEEEIASILEPGEMTSWTGPYVVTEEDASAGSIHNTATVSAYPPGSAPAVEDEASLVLEPAP